MTGRTGRLDVGVLGAGRVGAVLGTALGAAGHRITAISTSSESNRERVEAMLPGVRIADEAEVIERSELVLVAVPGDELPGLVEGAQSAGLWRPGQILIHTAVEHGADVFAPAVGTIPIALHPAMEFTGTSVDLTRLRQTVVAVTAPAPVLPIAQALVIEMGAEPLVIDEGDRPAYAEAVAITRDFSRSIIDQSAQLLRDIGVEDPASVLRSLATSAVENALARSRWTPAPLRAPQEEAES